MSSYEVEHNIPTQTPPSNSNSNSAAPRRPDFASFYARVTQIDTTATNNPYAVPIPADVSAANRLAAEAYEQIRVRVVSDAGGQDELLAAMVEELLRGVEAPVRKVEGVGDGFLDELERIPIKSLKPTDVCPICANPFIDDPYPLIVRLPCHPSHIYDLGCIAPWLKLQSTCPLDRTDLLQGQRKREEETRRRRREKEEERRDRRGEGHAGRGEEDEGDEYEDEDEDDALGMYA